MTVEAKPPIRRNSGVGSVVIVLVALALSVPVCLAMGVAFYWLFGVRSEPTYTAPEVSYGYTTPAVYEPTISGEFESRLSAAQQIQDTTQRDESFAIIAAKHASHSEEANQALGQIQDNVRRDAAAWDAARRFSEHGASSEALNLVNRMQDQKNRDAALRAIATGEWPDQAPGRGGMETTTTADAAGELH